MFSSVTLYPLMTVPLVFSTLRASAIYGTREASRILTRGLLLSSCIYQVEAASTLVFALPCSHRLPLSCAVGTANVNIVAVACMQPLRLRTRSGHYHYLTVLNRSHPTASWILSPDLITISRKIDLMPFLLCACDRKDPVAIGYALQAKLDD